MQADDRFRELIDQSSPAPEPTTDQFDAARAALHQAMTAAEKPDKAVWRRPRFAWAAAATATAVVLGVLALPSSTPPLDANLALIARSARTVTVDQLPTGSYTYVHSVTVGRNVEEVDGGSLTYLLVESIDRWTRGSSQREDRTFEPPRFLTSGDAEIYYASDLPQTDRIGATETVPATDVPNQNVITGLPTDKDELRSHVYDELSTDPDWSPDDESRTLAAIAEYLNPALNPPPHLRAALLELIGELGVVTEMLDEDGVKVSLTYTRPGPERWLHELEFDSIGNLMVDRLTLSEAGAGSNQRAGLFSETTYSLPAVVDAPGVLPAP